MRKTVIGILALSWLTGCSALAPVSKGYLQANVAAYEALPVAVQQAQPEFFQRVYFTASVMVTPPSDWRIALHSPQPLQLPAAVPVWLRYQLDEQTFRLLTHWQLEPARDSQAPAAGKTAGAAIAAVQPAERSTADGQRPKEHTGKAQTTQAETIQTQTTKTETSNPRPYVYVLRPITDIENQPFWQQYQQHHWEGDKPAFDYFLQPELATDTRQIELRYQLARHGGFLSAGAFARQLFVGRDKQLAKICEGDKYRYLKTSACGAVQITELATQSTAATGGALQGQAVMDD
jgi:hypothetical protein